MPEILLDGQQENEVLLDEQKSIANGETLLDPMQPVQMLPTIDPSKTYRPRMQDVQVHPDYFNNLNRAASVGVVDGLVDAGKDQLQGKTNFDRIVDAQKDISVQPTGMEMLLQPGAEALGAGEAVASTIYNFFSHGLVSAASLWDAINQPLVRHMHGDDANAKWEGHFVEDYISTQGKISAALGTFYDYGPVLDTANRDVEAVAKLMKHVTGDASEYLGNTTLEQTGSPILAAVAKTTPDALLMALPFIPKGLKSLREARTLRQFEKDVAADAANAVKGTSSLSAPLRMPVDQLQALLGKSTPLHPEAVARTLEEVTAGKATGDIIVETVDGVPTSIISGAENAVVIPQIAAKNGLTVKSVIVRTQERAKAVDTEALQKQADAGMKDIVENQQKMEVAEQGRNRTVVQKLVHMFVDTSGNVKAAILKSMGVAGEAVIRDFSLKAGAVPKAHMMFQDFFRQVYSEKSPSDLALGFRKTIDHLGQKLSEVDLFNVLVASRRVASVALTKGADTAGGKAILEGPVKPQNATGNIWAIRQTLGDARFAQLNARADQVFQTMKGQLDRLRDNGVISVKQYNRMLNSDFLTKQFIEEIDPLMLESKLRGSKVSIGESGIYLLKGTAEKTTNLDVQSLVAEYLARTEGRIFRNNANRALFRAAEATPDNGLVSIGAKGDKVPEGMSQIKVMIDGKPQRMFMKDAYAGEWLTNDPGINVAVANVFRIINGTFVVKPLATGMNPAFALVNFPRDIAHAWKATGNEYSAFLPRYLGQIFHDMWEVRKDVWNKDGAYRDFVNEGGGMNFLAHGGFDPLTGFNSSKDLLRSVGVYKGTFGRKLTETKETLSKLNEFSELLVRLAIRNRVLKNQASRGEMPNGPQATFIARNYLDFSQGGSATKALESFVPYTNAASQAIRTAFREYRRGGRAASVAALKDLQLVSMKAAHSSWAWMENPQAMAQVDPHQAYTNYVYPTGLSFTDENGNRRHLTIQIAMDTTSLPFTALFDRAVAKHALLATGIDPNDVPSDHFLSEIGAMIPILGSIRTGTPTFQAAAALFSNKDIWANRDIWTGDPNVMPGARRTQNTEGSIAELLGSTFPQVASPVQLQKAWRTYVPSNFYIDSSDFLAKMIQRSSDPVTYADMVSRDTSDIALQLIAEVPGLNRMIHLTHPAAQTTPELRQLAQEVATWREIEGQAVDAAVRKKMVLGDTSDFTRLVQSVAAVRPQDAERVVDLFVTQIAVESMYKNNKYDIGFVGQDWFNLLAGQNPETRAALYYWKSVSLSNENARNLDAVIAQIDKVGGRRIRTDGFDEALKQIISQYGTRKDRLRVVEGEE